MEAVQPWASGLDGSKLKKRLQRIHSIQQRYQTKKRTGLCLHHSQRDIWSALIVAVESTTTHTHWTWSFTFPFLPALLWGYSLSHITSFVRSVKEIREMAWGVATAGLTTNRPCQSSHNRYFCSTTERWKCSLSYSKWENAVAGLSCPRPNSYVSRWYPWKAVLMMMSLCTNLIALIFSVSLKVTSPTSCQ